MFTTVSETSFSKACLCLMWFDFLSFLSARWMYPVEDNACVSQFGSCDECGYDIEVLRYHHGIAYGCYAEFGIVVQFNVTTSSWCCVWLLRRIQYRCAIVVCIFVIRLSIERTMRRNECVFFVCSCDYSCACICSIVHAWMCSHTYINTMDDIHCACMDVLTYI